MRRVSIVFPSYNEAKRLPSTLDETITFCREQFDEWEIIVVDDGSRDDTERIVRFHAEHVRYLKNESNVGKGRSVKRGMLEARLDFVLFSDVDLSTPIREATSLLEALEAGADVAIASRVRSDKVVRRTPLRRFLGAGFRLFVRMVALRGIRDTQCGFKMFRREVAREVFARQKLDGWAFDVEVLFLARRLGYSVVEVPVEWHESDDSRLGIWSPLQMARDILRVRCLHRDVTPVSTTEASSAS